MSPTALLLLAKWPPVPTGDRHCSSRVGHVPITGRIGFCTSISLRLGLAPDCGKGACLAGWFLDKIRRRKTPGQSLGVSGRHEPLLFLSGIGLSFSMGRRSVERGHVDDFGSDRVYIWYVTGRGPCVDLKVVTRLQTGVCFLVVSWGLGLFS